jgi:hypothetical protein
MTTSELEKSAAMKSTSLPNFNNLIGMAESTSPTSKLEQQIFKCLEAKCLNGNFSFFNQRHLLVKKGGWVENKIPVRL